MITVVDASVGIKWFVPEILSDIAARLQQPTFDLHVPTLFDVEVGNIAWKKVRRAELTPLAGSQIVMRLSSVPAVRHDPLPFLSDTLDLALATGRTVYDCCYLSLAIRLGGTLITADERFRNALTGHPSATSIVLLKDLP